MRDGDRDSGGGKPSEVLTEAQLACVRLVHKGPSKVIARHLGISNHTVDDHLRQAMRRLGVQTRYDAAAVVAAWDAGGGAYPQDLMPQVESIVPQLDTAMLVASSAHAETPVSLHRNVLREERMQFGAPDLRSIGLARLTRYWLGSLFDDLTGPNRLRGTLTMALILSVIVLVLVGIGNALQVSVQTYSGH